MCAHSRADTHSHVHNATPDRLQHIDKWRDSMVREHATPRMAHERLDATHGNYPHNGARNRLPRGTPRSNNNARRSPRTHRQGDPRHGSTHSSMQKYRERSRGEEKAAQTKRNKTRLRRSSRTVQSSTHRETCACYHSQQRTTKKRSAVKK